MRYWRPWRGFLIWLSEHTPEVVGEAILDYLYSDDSLIVFKEGQ
jgi:hypothetical protein